MTTHLLAELTTELSNLDEQPLALAYATLAAMRQDADGADLRELVLAVDLEPVMAWLRAHGWLAADALLALGPVARFAMVRDHTEQAAATAAVEAESGWLLDMFGLRDMPRRIS